MTSKTRLTLDLKDSQSFDTLILHRGDSNSRVIEIELTDAHAPVTLTSDMSAKIDASTNGVVVADGEQATVDTDNNIILFTVTDKMTSLPGQSKISLTVTEEESVITAQTFRAIVDDSVINEGSKFEPTGGTVKQFMDEITAARGDFKNLAVAMGSKANKATTLAGYGITDAYTKTEVDTVIATKADKETTYTKSEVDTKLSVKLDNTEGSVKRENIEVNAVGTDEIDSAAVNTINIADGAVTADKIANKSVTSDKIANSSITSLKLANNAVSGSNIAQNQISTNHLQNGAVTTDKLADEVKTSINNKSNKATTLAGYGITDAYTKDEVDNELATKADLVQSKNIFDFDTWAKCLQSLSNPIYRGSLDDVDFDEKSITFTGTEAGSYTNGWVNNPAKMNIAVKPNTVYTFSWKFAGSSKIQIFLFFNGKNTDETRLSKVSTTGSGYLTFTTLEDTSYITIRFDNLATSTVSFSEIIIEEGDKKSLYLPYEVAEGVRELAKSTETAISDMTSNTDTALEAKYDASNVETGSGELTVYTQSAIDSELVKSCEFKYQKFGGVVDIFFNIVFNAGSFSYMQFTGLPFAPDIISNQNRQISVTSKNTQMTSYLTNSWLTLKTIEAITVTQDEVLRGTLQIKLK